MPSSDNPTSELATDADASPPEGTRRVWTWINWALALLTAPAAALAMVFGLGAVMSTAACSDAECPNLGPSGVVFSLLYYGAPAIAVLTIFVSVFTATRRRGVIVPLCGWALLAADVAAMALTFTR